jgi:hypothetical protein
MSSVALLQAFEARRLRLPNFSWVLPAQENGSGGLAGLGAPQTAAHAKGTMLAESLPRLVFLPFFHKTKKSLLSAA